MHLVWKLLRRHMNVFQLLGFFVANLAGMWVIMLGIQFYKDIIPLLNAEDTLFGQNNLVISKRISAVTSMSGGTNAFTVSDSTDLRRQPFCRDLGAFTATQYKATATMGVRGQEAFSTEMFFEAVPDRFVETDSAAWHYTAGSDTVPVIMPRAYIALYNFGFAQSRGLPKLSTSLADVIDMHIFVNAHSANARFVGHVVGFSSRVNTILVPQAFVDWSNATYEPGKSDAPTRLILKAGNITDEQIAVYMDKMGYEVEDDKLDAGKASYFLGMIITLVLIVGVLVSVLSFFILMLSVYLLVEKNSRKLQNLLLIGYSQHRVALPYQLLTVGLNLAVLIIAFVLVIPPRNYYMQMTSLMFPQVHGGSLLPAALAGAAIFTIVTIFNTIAIRRKMHSVWNEGRKH